MNWREERVRSLSEFGGGAGGFEKKKGRES